MRILLTVIIAACSALSYGQGLTSEGREFYLGHIHGSHIDAVSAYSSAQMRVYAIVSSYTDNEVYISYFNPQSGVETQPNKFTIMAHRSVQVQIDDINMRVSEPGDVGEFRSCHIVSKHPITVHYYSSGSCVNGGYLALPVGTWGKQYVIASDPDNPGYGGWSNPPWIPSLDMSNGCFMVVAAMDGTLVTISPNARTGGGHAGATQGTGSTGSPQPYSVMLNRGQCYLVKSVSALNGNTDDMSGSIVKADKPIAVITAHENANVGDGQVKETHHTDARDLIIEQAIPWEFASHTGIATIPMLDSKGTLEGGYGEDIKVFVADVNNATTVSVSACTGNPTVDGIAPYASPMTRTNVQQPLQFFCDSGKRIQAVQYELRSDGDGAPFPAPAMMNIIPYQNWRNSYLWYIPTKPTVPGGLPNYEEYYVTVIGNAETKVSINGANADNPPSIDQTLKSVVKKWTCVPGIPNVTATTYKISSAVTYYAHSTYPFMVYVFGYTATHESVPMPDFVYTYSGFAFPAGMRGKVSSKGRIGTTVETSCSSWKICATDSSGGGIKSIALLNDPNGDFLNRTDIPSAQTEQVAKNCVLEMATSLDGLEVTKLLPELKLCATIRVVDSTQDAYAPIVVTDAGGNLKFISLSYNGKQLIPGPGFTGFSKVRVGDTEEKRLVIRTQNSFLVEKIEISDPSVFAMSFSKTLPFLLQGNDSLVVTIAFTPKDTVQRSATIRFSNECMLVEQSFTAKGGTGLIMAEDRDFGTITQSSKRCLDIRVENKGSIPYRLMPGLTIIGSAEFTIDSAKLAQLPIVINPGGVAMVKACYTPQDESADTATIHWVTDIPEPYSSSIRTTSTLFGKTVEQGVLDGEQKGHIAIRPNPNNGTFNLDLHYLPEEKLAIAIYNTLGIACYNTTTHGGRTIELQLPPLPSGNYIVKITGAKATYDLRLIIQ
jgi:hypothetical protein